MSWANKFSKPYRVEHGKKFRLKDHDPADTAKLHSQEHAEELLAKGVARMAELQDKLYADNRWGLLLIFQAMDAAGKDGAIKHVMSGVNPQGCQVFSFKTPSPEELDHDFLWRNMKCLPERGRIGIFNRSYYEEVLVVRVHPEILANEKIPAPLVTKNIWEERFQDICGIERYLARNGFVIRKFFLNVSKKEQKKRFLDRLAAAGEELEVFFRRSARARTLGRLHGRLRRHDRQHFDARMRPGSSFPRTTNGSPAWPWQRPSWMRSTTSTSPIPRWMHRNKKNWKQRASCC